GDDSQEPLQALASAPALFAPRERRAAGSRSAPESLERQDALFPALLRRQQTRRGARAAARRAARRRLDGLSVLGARDRHFSRKKRFFEANTGFRQSRKSR